MLVSLRERLFPSVRPGTRPYLSSHSMDSSAASGRLRRSTFNDDIVDSSESNALKSKSSYGVDSALAGAILLDKFQTDWMRLHELNEDNVKSALMVDDHVDKLLRSYDQHQLVVSAFVSQLSTLPVLTNSLCKLTSSLVKLEVDFAEVERRLVSLEDTIDIGLHQKRQLEHEFQLALYKQRQVENLDILKNKLIVDCQVRLKAVENRRLSLLRERQETFGEAFNEEMEHYKIHGHLERVKSESDDGLVRLEDIEIETEDDALDAFLATDDNVQLIQSVDDSSTDNKSEEYEESNCEKD